MLDEKETEEYKVWRDIERFGVSTRGKDSCDKWIHVSLGILLFLLLGFGITVSFWALS